jgi:hypothetical protein
MNKTCFRGKKKNISFGGLIMAGFIFLGSGWV